MGTKPQGSDFFTAGGTLRPDAPSYVKRPTDDEFSEWVLAGEFCYVLTPRQMGKSSLMIRTARWLKAQGVKTAIVDLTQSGTLGVTIEKWYLAFITRLKVELKLSIDPQAWWQEHAALGPVQQFINFLHDIVLGEIKEQVVIFVDEIDSTLGLDFTDDFFAAIRATYNARANDPIYNRLTFVLLGVATPGDLIEDQRRTPFNIGQAVTLQEFSRSDAQVLQSGLEQLYPEQGQAILDRIFYWTNGHPYLTQKLCLEVAKDTISHWDESSVDAVVERLFLSEATKKESNLRFVQDSIAVSPIKRHLLRLYRQAYTGRRPIKDNERDLVQNRLKLSGLVRAEKGILKARNQIYHRVFNETWISENMPVDWPRRLAIASPLGALLVVVFFFAPIYFGLPVPWTPATSTADTASIQAQTLKNSFLSTSSADARMTDLYELIDLGFEDMARALFFEELSPAEQITLFENVDIQEVGLEAITAAVDLIYEWASANVRLAILAKLFESEGHESYAKELFFDELSSAEQIDLFRKATVQLVGPQMITVFRAISHSASPDVRLVILARLFQAEDYTARAAALFLEELSLEEQIVLFQNADPQTVGPELVTVVSAIYTQLNNTQKNNKLLGAMTQPLHEIDEPEATGLAIVIEQWLIGREAYNKAEYETALSALDSVIEFNPDNPEAYFDRALVYIELEHYEETLADLETTLQLDETEVFKVGLKINSNPILSRIWVESIDQYPMLQALVPRSDQVTSPVFQAFDVGTTHISLSVYQETGELACFEDFELTQGQSYKIDLDNICPTSFSKGSASAAASSRTIGLNTEVMTLHSGELQYVKRAASEWFSEPLLLPEFFFPVVANSLELFSSIVAVQNASSDTIEAEMYLLDRDGKTFAKKSVILPPQGTSLISISDVQDTSDNPQGWSGATRIIAKDGRITTTSVSCKRFFCIEYNGLPIGSHHWFVPGLARDVSAAGEIEAISLLTIMNISETDQAEVTIIFQGVETEKSLTLPPLGSAEISTEELDELTLGSAAEILSEGAEVVVTAQYLNFADNQGAAYNGLAVEQGGTDLFFPDVTWAEQRNSDTIIYLQNLTDMEIIPTLFLYDRVKGSGGKLPRQPLELKLDPVGAYQTPRIDIGKHLAEVDLTAWEGSAIVRDDADMGGIIITRSNGEEQWATAYNAIPGD